MLTHLRHSLAEPLELGAASDARLAVINGTPPQPPRTTLCWEVYRILGLKSTFIRNRLGYLLRPGDHL